VSEQLLATIIVVLIMLLVGFPVHEFSHAYAAWRLGDSTARLFGRLTLNPVVHFDPIGGTLLVITFLLSATQGLPFGIGWAKPTPVNPLNLRGGRQGEAIVAAAGPVSNLVLALIAAVPFRLLNATDLPFVLTYVLYLFVLINIALMFFNLIPVPPFDGSRILFALLPPRLAWQWRPLFERYGTLVLLAAVFLPIFPGSQTLVGAVFSRIGLPIIDFLLGV
jgi:Zn-dependent protease